MIFWRLAGGDEEELLALRVLLFDLVAIFFEEAAKMIVEDFVAGPRAGPGGVAAENGRT